MAKRRTKEELLVEFHRLCDVFETIWECQFPYLPEELVVCHKKYVVTPEGMLRWLEDGRCTASEIVFGMRQGLNDTVEQLVYLMEDDPGTATKIFAAYRERTGRDFWDDAGNPLKAAKAIVKRGSIANETEFYLLKGLMSNVDQKLFTGKMRDRAYEMLDHFDMGTP